MLGANLENASLLGANLEFADMSGVTLLRADLNGAYLVKANLTGAEFPLTQLGGANLTGAILRDARFSGSRVSGANLSETSQVNAQYGTFINENFPPFTIFLPTNLDGVNMSEGILVGTDFKNASLSGAVLGNIQFDETTLWPPDYKLQSSE